MKNTNETIETEIVEDEFNAPVLKSAKELSTLVNVDTLVSKYKDISETDISLPVEVIAENFLEIEKGFKAFRKARTSIEAKRKEIGEPAFRFHKKVIEIAKEVQGKINPYEDKLKALVDKVENEEKRKQLEAEQKEAERVEAIRNSIERIKNTPMSLFSSSSEEIKNSIDSIVIPESESYQEFFEEAIEVYKNTIDNLQSMYETKVQAEGAEEAERKHNERVKAEEAERESERQKEREEFEREKAEFQKQKEEMQRIEDAKIEEENRRAEEERADELQKQQDEERNKRMKDASIERESKIAETLSCMNKYNDMQLLLNEIIAGAIPNVEWR